MTTKDKLVIKFENDMEKRNRFYRFLLSIDQMANVLFWNGSQDETVSSHIGRRIADDRATWFDKVLCKLLIKLEAKHCLISRGE